MAAKMLCAYYDNSCDSRVLFERLEIAKKSSFEKHLNKYPVICLDITSFTTRYRKDPNIVDRLQHDVREELMSVYQDAKITDNDDLMAALIKIKATTGQKFIMIIDEWDAILREFDDVLKTTEAFVDLLRRLFKGQDSVDVFAGAYITGILPIKKYKTQSALNNFREYSMIRPGKLAKYFGFTKNEVKKLCKKHRVSFDKMEQWYDGYQIGNEKSMFNPYSVMEAINSEDFGSYWSNTGAYDAVTTYIQMNFEGLKAVEDTSWKEIIKVIDLVLIPRKHIKSPALIIELKYDKAVDTAIDQIKEKQYPDKIAEYSGEIMLVGMSVGDTEVESACRAKYQFNINDRMNDLLVKSLLLSGLVKDRRRVTLDYDNQVIPTEKRDAKYTYKKMSGYFPGIAQIDLNPCYIENRDGNAPVKLEQDEVFDRLFKVLRDNGIEMEKARMDCGSYTTDVVGSVAENCRWFYNQRDASETTFDVMNNDFGWDSLRCSTKSQNTVFMILMAMTRNFYRGGFVQQRKTLPSTYDKYCLFYNKLRVQTRPKGRSLCMFHVIMTLLRN